MRYLVIEDHGENDRQVSLHRSRKAATAHAIRLASALRGGRYELYKRPIGACYAQFIGTFQRMPADRLNSRDCWARERK